MRPTEKLLQQPRGTGWAEGQDLRRLSGEQVVIYQSFLGLPKYSKNFPFNGV